MAQFDSIPLWVIVLGLVVGLSVVSERGDHLGKRVAKERGLSKHPGEPAVCGALLGLMAFMMAFTFGAAVTRYAKTRALAIADANVAGSLSLVADTLPETHGPSVRKLVREYVEIRAAAVRDQDLEKSKVALARSTEIQRELWQIGNEVRGISEGVSPRLYTNAVLKLIENDTARQTTALYSRLPGIVWIMLGFLAVLANGVLGLSAGLHGRRSRLVATVFIVAYAFVFVLIVDLDRPIRSLFRQGDPAAAHILERMF